MEDIGKEKETRNGWWAELGFWYGTRVGPKGRTYIPAYISCARRYMAAVFSYRENVAGQRSSILEDDTCAVSEAWLVNSAGTGKDAHAVSVRLNACAAYSLFSSAFVRLHMNPVNAFLNCDMKVRITLYDADGDVVCEREQARQVTRTEPVVAFRASFAVAVHRGEYALTARVYSLVPFTVLSGSVHVLAFHDCGV